MREWKIIIHVVVHLPKGVDIINLINDLRNFSWEASEILLYYAKLIKSSVKKENLIKSK